LAPGLISVFAKRVYREFEKLEEVKLRVGALPLYPSNALKYNITWSTEGLINEYIQDCLVIKDGKLKTIPALGDWETIIIDGTIYEAFNTSGGLGTLHKTLEGKVQNLNYKTIRHLHHRHYMKFLLDDLKLRLNPSQLIAILESAIPTTSQDKCIIYVEVKGLKEGKYQQLTLSKTVYHQKIGQKDFSAIQLCTAAGIIGPVKAALKCKLKGHLKIEELDEDAILNTAPVKQIFNL
jgi:saccharopine dehydrogenase-like NADP-dependent oxidoreductase